MVFLSPYGTSCTERCAQTGPGVVCALPEVEWNENPSCMNAILTFYGNSACTYHVQVSDRLWSPSGEPGGMCYYSDTPSSDRLGFCDNIGYVYISEAQHRRRIATSHVESTALLPRLEGYLEVRCNSF